MLIFSHGKTLFDTRGFAAARNSEGYASVLYRIDYREAAAFLDARMLKRAHLQQVSQLLDAAAETLRDYNHEKDQPLMGIVREI